MPKFNRKAFIAKRVPKTYLLNELNHSSAAPLLQSSDKYRLKRLAGGKSLKFKTTVERC